MSETPRMICCVQRPAPSQAHLIALSGVLTANIHAFFVERTQADNIGDPVVAKRADVLTWLAVLEGPSLD